LLLLLTDTTSTTTVAVTNIAVDFVSSELAPGLEFLALAPRPPGVATCPDGQALPVPAATTSAVQPPTATTPAAAQQPGGVTTVPAAASMSTAATSVALAVLPESTTTSSAVPITSPIAVAMSTALLTSTATPPVVTAPPPSTSTAASSSSSTGVAVAVSCGSDPPGSTYIASTQSVTPPVIVVFSQDVLKRYDGSSSPKEYMDHFDIIADVNGWRTNLDKLKHLKAALDGRAAYQIKGLDESDSTTAFATLRRRLLSHFGSSNEGPNACQQFYNRLQMEGEAINEYADALLKLARVGWPGQIEQRDADLQNRFVQGLRLPELKEYLRLQYADLGFKETVKKARFYMEVKETSKPKKASVRFASSERDPVVNTITSSTVDLEPIMNCLQDMKGRMDKTERRGPPARVSTPPSRSTSPAPPQSQNNQRGRSAARPRNDNAGYQRDQFEDQLQRFDDVPPQNYPVSPQPRRFQTPSVGWNDANYQPPTQAWGGADPRFQRTPPWWTNPGPRYGSPQSAPTPLMRRGGWSGGSGRGSAARGQWFNSNRGRGFQGYGRGFGDRAKDEQPTERHEDPTPRPGPNAEPRPGRGRGTGRGCYMCGRIGCHSRNHPLMGLTDKSNDTDMTDVRTSYLSFSVPVTASVAANVTVTDSATVDDITAASHSMQFLINLSRLANAPTLGVLPPVVIEGKAPNIDVTIHSVEVPLMLDSGAQISVLPSSLVANFDPLISLPSVTREVRTFGSHQITLRGPITLDLQMCDFRIRHPFYFIDVPTPAIGGYDLMQAARLVIDVANRRVWSRRQLATESPIYPNPELLVPDSSAHSSVAATEPPPAHRDETSGVVTPSPDGDPLTASANEPGVSVTSPEELPSAVAPTDVGQSDVVCTQADESDDEEGVAALVAEINQCYQDQVKAIGSRPACCMLSDTEYSDFDESDGDDQWEEYWQDYQDYLNSGASSKESAETDIHIVTDEEHSDEEGELVKALFLQSPADVCQFGFEVEDELPDLPPFTPRELEQMWQYAPPCSTTRASSTRPKTMLAQDAQLEFEEQDSPDLICFESDNEMEAEPIQSLTCPALKQLDPATPPNDLNRSAQPLAPLLTTGPQQLVPNPAHVPALVSITPHTSPRVSSCVYGQSLVSTSSPHTPHTSSRHSYREGACANVPSLSNAAVVNSIYVSPLCAPSNAISRRVSDIFKRPIILSRSVLDPCAPSFQIRTTQPNSTLSEHQGPAASLGVVADPLTGTNPVLPPLVFVSSAHLSVLYTYSEPGEPKPPDIM